MPDYEPMTTSPRRQRDPTEDRIAGIREHNTRLHEADHRTVAMVIRARIKGKVLEPSSLEISRMRLNAYVRLGEARVQDASRPTFRANEVVLDFHNLYQSLIALDSHHGMNMDTDWNMNRMGHGNGDSILSLYSFTRPLQPRVSPTGYVSLQDIFDCLAPLQLMSRTAFGCAIYAWAIYAAGQFIDAAAVQEVFRANLEVAGAGDWADPRPDELGD
jgi:hypothetical protein